MNFNVVKLLILTLVVIYVPQNYSKELKGDCVNCRGEKTKDLEGGPDHHQISNLIASTSMPIAMASSSSVGNTDSKKGYQFVFCERYQLCQDTVDVETLIEKMEASPYSSSMKEFWSAPACEAQNKTDSTVPILFNTARDVVRSEEFPEVVHDYFVNDKKDPQTWLNAINSQSSDGYTFLDFMQYNIARNRYSLKPAMDAALRIVSYLCKNGGVYSKYKNTNKCPQ